MEKVIRIERGWVGHYCCSSRCLFRRNTLLSLGDKKIVVSTVGRMVVGNEIEKIGLDRYYETMAFFAEKKSVYYDADVEKQIIIDSNWSINEIYAEIEANNMHEAVVNEIVEKLENNKVINIYNN